jgi:hypothetical protein
MNPKLCKRFGLAGVPGKRFVSIGSEAEIEKTSSVRDATLLLSIADICNSEIKTGGLNNLWRDDLTLPNFPSLEDSVSPDEKLLTPRTESLRDFFVGSGGESLYPSNRVRSVSIDSPKPTTMLLEDEDRVTSPLIMSSSAQLVSPMQTPRANRRLPPRKQSLRLSVKARKEYVEAQEETLSPPSSPRSPRPNRSKSLQGQCPKGVPIKKIHRKKFSWKNYPELEQFLIANREEYLRHSALNYTVQQKKYNNELTERLLELATKHGYLFDEDNFNFVTVRDRIRCYYKSYVQSAKKRGVLMGYAARKAGLLTEDDLEEYSHTPGQIVVTP